MSNIQIIEQDIYAVQDHFNKVLCDQSISFEREAGFALQTLTANDYAMKVALNNRQSVINAVTNIASIGISLNPAKKQAYLVPRDGKICLDISYMGLMDLALSTGSIKWAQAAVVYESDVFELNGYDSSPVHKFNPFSKERGEIVGVYCVVKTADGDYLTHTMTIAEVYAIRDRSAGWKSGKSTPWKTDPLEMIKKTCVKQAYKYWPKTDRLENAIKQLNDDGEGIDFDAPVEPVMLFDSVAACEAIHACETMDELKAKWREYGAAAVKAGDKGGYAIIQNAKDERKKELEAANAVQV